MRAAIIVWMASGCAYITDKEYTKRMKLGEDGGTECAELQTFWADADGDGFGNPEVTFQDCEPADGMVDNDGDCDDTDDTEFPGATWFVDADGDGYGDALKVVESCEAMEGTTSDNTDCDDEDAAVSPSAAEDCATEVDDDCSGEINQADAIGCSQFYADADGDGFGGSDSLCLCTATDEYPEDEIEDCDDSTAEVSPDADEICNDGIDNNCDGGSEGCGLASILDPSRADVRWEGPSTDSAMGASLALGGDVDGDGERDVLVSAYKAGTMLIVSGPSLDGSGVTTLTGTSTDWYARAMATADVDGDGQADLIVGAPRASVTGRVHSGLLVVHYGPVDGDTVLNEPDAQIWGPVGNAYLGRNLWVGGDLNGDGGDDLIVGSVDAKFGGLRVGMVALVSTPIADDFVDTAVDGSANARFYGEVEGDMFGIAVAATGDWTGDGLPDLVVAARAAGLTTGVVYGFDSGTALAGDWNGADADRIISGVGPGARTGDALMTPGDLNGDGVDDLLVGAPMRNLWGSRRGAAYLVTDFSSGSIDEVASLELDGLIDNGHFGSALSGTGDVDGSGPGIAVGAPNAGAGAVFLFPGGLTGVETTDAAIGRIDGLVAGDRLGSAVLGDLDYDEDGRVDLIVGAESALGGLGEAVVFLGGGL
jgi:hypothetical protein